MQKLEIILRKQNFAIYKKKMEKKKSLKAKGKVERNIEQI